MQDIFITKIKINKVRNIKDFEINLSENERKHLIVTGKNGSGKTSLLAEIKQFLAQFVNGNAASFNNWKKELVKEKIYLERFELGKSVDTEFQRIQVEKLENALKQFGGTELFLSLQGEQSKVASVINNYIKNSKFLLKSFDVKHYIEVLEVSGVAKIEHESFYDFSDKAGKNFLQYLINLRFERLEAKDENETQKVEEIDEWFEMFEKQLTFLFDEPNLKLEYDKQNYDFKITENGNLAYNLNQLSDGYSAILDIVTELIMRMEEHKTKSYDVQGIVLIDEIETHLHIDLQKKILPFLTSFFPKIQFIVTTHSPFVLSSIENAVVCDLENRIVTEDLSGYSWETLVESYFDSDKYSDELKAKISNYEDLLNKENLTEAEKDELLELKVYFSKTPTVFADELAIKLNELNLMAIAKNKK